MEWHKQSLLLYHKTRDIMKNTDFTFDSLSTLISSDSSLRLLEEMIEDMDLEITEIRKA